ncbi:DUF5063 domain-containing protein [Winogradskyella undariae]|uniref:DUF5063 domain-containing protein n=1 Tax=Winogradskyella undariae TaxID=1285465 RepID=UPI00156AC011|nr:DUF5063 domain-containing protein [Winogradskyella undariae]NRR91791.1 DUF5063 domain-containing protein [Winogradskyella undariae]
MKNLEKLINRITEFGLNDKVQSANKELEIQQLLIGIYSEYLNLDVEFDDEDFEGDPTFDYDSIKKNIEANFPDIGWYHSVFESHLIIPDAYLVTGDAIDDLSDIIKDMLEIKWQFENASEKYAKWCFKDLMQNHSEQHLVDFLKYLKDKKG